jgi:precorrin-3B synthase
VLRTVVAPSQPADAPGLVRGACPSVHQPFMESDGAMVRVQVAGGVLTAAHMIRLAAAGQEAGATIELTSRSNLQLRGVDPRNLGALVAALVDAGLAPPDRGSAPAGPGSPTTAPDVLVSPTAGIDQRELMDTRGLAEEARAVLVAGTTARALSPKFGIVLDGGGEINVRGRSQDLALGAAMVAGGLRLELAVGESLADHSASAGGSARPDRLAGHSAFASRRVSVTVPVESALAVIEAAARLASTGGGRLDGWIERAGRPEVVRWIARLAGAEVETADIPRSSGASPTTLAPVGRVRQRSPGVIAIGAMPVLGRLAPAALIEIGQLAGEMGGGEVRLTPWRSFLLPGVASGAADEVVARLSELELACFPGDPAIGVVACAGAAGCPSGLADTQADGRRLVAALRARAAGRAPSRVMTVHLSGCPKRCAGRQGHDLTLMAGPDRDTYTVHRGAGDPGGGASRQLGDPVLSPADSNDAIAAVLAAGCAP